MIDNNPASFPDREPAPEPQQVRVRMPDLPTIITYGLIGVTVFFYIMQMLSIAVWGYAIYQMDWLEYFGARINSAIRAGDYWRFITPVFLHGSLMHIFFNMYALFSIGGLLERHLGYARFIALYFLSAFSGNVFSFLFTGDSGYSIGASTAVFGLIGAQLVFFYQNRQLFGSYARQAISNIVFIIGINLFIGLAPNIDNWGHVGGLLGGAMFAWFASPLWAVSGIAPDLKLADQRETREILTGTFIVILVFGGLAAWGLFFK
ncbi:MAG: rhomboid family intramembrane serine protease [Anaerolineales bacterium]|nr:rhomboid family intramembrane serine protease [Anaerolineales bacterium]